MKYQISAAEINQSETEIIGGPKLSIVSAGGTLAIAKKKKKKKLYGPFFLRMGFNCLKATATSRRQFTFYHSVPKIRGTQFIDLGKMKS